MEHVNVAAIGVDSEVAIGTSATVALLTGDHIVVARAANVGHRYAYRRIRVAVIGKHIALGPGRRPSMLAPASTTGSPALVSDTALVSGTAIGGLLIGGTIGAASGSMAASSIPSSRALVAGPGRLRDRGRQVVRPR